MMEQFYSCVNSVSDRWLVWMISTLVDSTLLLGLVGLIWWLIRKQVGPQLGYLMFLIIPLKMVLPLYVAVPASLACWTSESLVSVVLGSPPPFRRPNQPQPSAIVEPVGDGHRDATDVPQTLAAQTLNVAADADDSEPVPVPAIPVADEAASGNRPVKTVGALDPVLPPERSTLTIRSFVMLLWLGTATLFVLLTIGRQRRLREQLIHRSARLEDEDLARMQQLCEKAGITTTVEFRVCDKVSSPAVWGMFRPQVILPRSIFSALSSRQLEWVVYHELAHIRRRDLLVLALQRLAAVLHFFNPAIWVANRMIDRLREFACDDYASHLSEVPATESSEAFLRVLQMARQNTPRLKGALGVFGLDSRAMCFERVGRLLSNDPPRSTPGWYSISGLLVLGIVTLPRLYAQADPVDAPADKPASSVVASDLNPAVPLAEEVGQFELHVVRPDGSPIPEIVAEIRSSFKPEADDVLRGTFVRKGNYGQFIRTTAEGVLTLKFPRKVTGFSVSLVAPGSGPYWAGWSSANHPEPIPATFTAILDDAWTVGAIVVDGDDQPVKDAEVRPFIDFKKRPGDSSKLGTGRHVTTDAAGQWKFESVPISNEEVFLEINHPEFRPIRQRLARAEFGVISGQEPVRKIVLDRGLTVTGRITDEAGNPVVDALVRTKFVNDLRQTRTGADGTYQLNGCESRIARIVVSAKGLATDMQELRITDDLAPVDFVMKPGGKVRIRVLDEEDRPIPQARIFFQRWRSEFFNHFEFDHVNQYADSDGVWEWNEAPLDVFYADICRPGGMYLPSQALISRDEEYVFHPPGPLVVTGKVVDAQSGQPLENFEVIPGFRYEDGRSSWDQEERFSGKEGSFVWRETGGRHSYLLRIEASGYRAIVSPDIKLDAGKTSIEFKMVQGRNVAAQILTPQGQPAVGARIALGTPGSQIQITNGDFNSISTYCEIQESDSTGRFRFLPQDRPYQLLIVHETGFAVVDATPEESPDQIDLHPWASVRGTYRVQGKPLANIPITIEGMGPSSWGENTANVFSNYHARTDRDGKFQFDRVYPGRGRIGREIAMMVIQGASEETSTCLLPVKLETAEVAEIEFDKSGHAVVGKMISTDPNAHVDWKQFMFRLRVRLPVLTPLAVPPFPQEIVADPVKRLVWLKNWETTEKGKIWTDLKHAHEANELRRQMLPEFCVSLKQDGSFRIDDVPPGEYLLECLRTTPIEVSIPPLDADGSGTVIDLGEILQN